MENKSSKIIIVVSGKRKSGKDFVTDAIRKSVGETLCHVMRVADPIKQHFCNLYNLDFREMLTSSDYKEQVRLEMIDWSDKQRENDPHIFCKAVAKEAFLSCKPVWILSDARIPSDVEYFRESSFFSGSKFYSIRVEADNATRESRNWKYRNGIDNVESECGLDNYKKWDFIFHNSINDDVGICIEDFCMLIQNDLAKHQI